MAEEMVVEEEIKKIVEKEDEVMFGILEII